MDSVATAIADPTRRTILEALARRPLTAGEIASTFPVSRPAISRHLRVLRTSGLVVDRVAGRSRIYSLCPDALQELASWIAELRPAAVWASRMDALDTEIRRAARDRRQLLNEQEETA